MAQTTHTRALPTRVGRAGPAPRTVLVYGLATLLAAFFAMPFFWALLTSFKTANQIYLFPPNWIPRPFAPQNWVVVWTIVPLARFFWNTVVVTVISLIGQLLSASLVAYGFARFRFPYRSQLFLLVLSTLMLPQHITLIPTYVLFKNLGWIDTYLPLIVPWFLGGGAFSIFLLRQFYMTIPLDLDEAAKIDGASYFTIYRMIILPLSKTALLALAILGFIWHWNDFLGPLIYLQSTEKFTVSIGLNFLRTSGFVSMGAAPITEHYLMAASLLATLPVLILFVVAQRQMVAGITLTGIKG